MDNGGSRKSMSNGTVRQWSRTVIQKNPTRSLAAKLMQIEKEVEAYEAAKAAHDRKMKKGWRR